MSRLAIGLGIVGLGIEAGDLLELAFGPSSVSSLLVVFKGEELYGVSVWVELFASVLFVDFWVLFDGFCVVFFVC